MGNDTDEEGPIQKRISRKRKQMSNRIASRPENAFECPGLLKESLARHQESLNSVTAAVWYEIGYEARDHSTKNPSLTPIHT